MVLIALMMPVLLLLIGAAIDMGAAMADKSRLETATDAAALAAGYESDVWQDITAMGTYQDRHSYCKTYAPPSSGGACLEWGSYTETHTGTVPVSRVLAREAEAEARAAIHPSWAYAGYRVDREWIEMRPGAEEAARYVFSRNVEGWRSGASIPAPEISVDPGARLVRVSAQSVRSTHFLGIAGIREITVRAGAVARPRR